MQLYYRKGTSGTWLQYGSDDTTAPYEWTFNPPSGTGLYQFCARARDAVGNWEAACSASEEETTYSTATPLITLASIATSPYAYAAGATVYYNNNGLNTGAFTVTVQVTDTGGGLKYMRFPTTTSAGTFSDTVTDSGLYGWGYTFTPTATFSGTVYITVGNTTNQWQGTPLTVQRDLVGPSVAMTVPDKMVSGLIPVQWSASDGLSGPTNVYTVSVMTDTGPLQLWLGNTSATSANFTPAFGHRYTFVVTATDNVRNTSQGTATTDAIEVTKYYYIGSSRVAMRRSATTGTEVTYLHTDHLGTVSVATNQSQTVLARTLNMPYGSVRWTSGTLPTDWGFTGQKDTGLGLVYLHARYYASWVGRFVSADTIVPGAGNPPSLNRYTYALNSPLKYVDPTGHFASDEELAQYLGFDNAAALYQSDLWLTWLSWGSPDDLNSWMAMIRSADFDFGSILTRVVDGVIQHLMLVQVAETGRLALWDVLSKVAYAGEAMHTLLMQMADSWGLFKNIGMRGQFEYDLTSYRSDNNLKRNTPALGQRWGWPADFSLAVGGQYISLLYDANWGDLIFRTGITVATAAGVVYTGWGLAAAKLAGTVLTQGQIIFGALSLGTSAATLSDMIDYNNGGYITGVTPILVTYRPDQYKAPLSLPYCYAPGCP